MVRDILQKKTKLLINMLTSIPITNDDINVTNNGRRSHSEKDKMYLENNNNVKSIFTKNV